MSADQGLEPYVGPVVAPQIDETFYSWVGRIAACFGGLDHVVTANLLFGGATPRFYPDFATGLASFQRYSGQSQLSVAELAMARTSYGYFANFFEPEERERLLGVVQGTGVSPYHGTGLPLAEVQARCLRYCPACHRDMDTAGLDRWWRRSHQLPSSFVCPDHGAGLFDSSITAKDMRAAFVLPLPVTCLEPPDAITTRLAPAEIGKLRLLAEAGVKCLDRLCGISRQERLNGYRQAWVAIYPNGPDFDAHQLHHALQVYWGPALSNEAFAAPISFERVKRLFQTREQSLPLLHLLVEVMLADNRMAKGQRA